MQLPIHTCAFKGGMNRDLSPNDYPNVCYYDAENFRVVVDNSDGMSSSSMSTVKGNLSSFILPTDTVLLGYAVLRDYLVILAKNSTDTTTPDRIYKILVSEILDTTSLPVTLSDVHIKNGGDLVYRADLGFDLNYPIRVVANYENSSVQKIYWVDGLNTLKHLNIIHNDTYNDLVNLDSQLLEILPNHTYGTYELEESIGGHLKAGRIQYSYQLYSVSGTETMFAPPSNLYNVTKSNITDGISFVGSELEDEINKSIRVTITFSSDVYSVFDRIRLVALTYEEYNDTPVVRVVAEQPLTSSTLTITDYGNSIGELVLEEFQVIKNDLIPATIESKNNYLFAANLQEQFFDIDETIEELAIPGKTFLDTRAYRWRFVTDTGVAYGTQQLTPGTDSIGVDSPYAPASWDCGIIHMTDTAWKVTIDIGANAHATALGNTFIDIASVDDDIEIYLYNSLDLHWNTVITLDIDTITNFTASSGTTLTVEGTGYVTDKPSELIPAFNHLIYTDAIVLHTTYTYNYSYLIGIGTTLLESTLNKDGVGNSPTLVLDPGTGPNFTLVGEDNDCINTYNDIENDEVEGHEYKYKYPLAGVVPVIDDLGGTGPYISYGFTHTDIAVGERTSITVDGTANIPILYSGTTTYGYQDPQNILEFTGYQRDEVYRFGIVFYDLKGRPSFTKWIADIRFPDNNEELVLATTWDTTYNITNSTLGSQMIARVLGIEFTIDWNSINTDYPGLLELLSGFQIVRVPRTNNDSTIKTQGIILPTHYPDEIAGSLQDTLYSSYNITSAYDYINDVGAGSTQIIPNVTNGDASPNKAIVELISPEIATNKQLDINSGDFLEVWGHLSYVTAGGGGGTDVNTREYGVSATGIYPLSPNYIDPITPESTAYHLVNDWRNEVYDAFVSQPEKRFAPSRSIGLWSFTARGYNDQRDAQVPEMTYKGTSLVAYISTFTNVEGGLTVANGEEAMYGRYRRYLGYSQYGGATYVERSYNSYIKVGEFTVLPDDIIATPIVNYEIYNGDVYINPFCFVKLFIDEDAEYLGHTGQVFVSFPVESKINVSHLMPNTANSISASASLTSTYSIAEKQSIGISQYPDGYPEIGDLYRYNSAYSAENASKIYPTKPFDFKSSVQKDVMITSSELKINGEYSDSWLKFKFNNYIELEGEYGAITRLVNYNDRLMAFQPRGLAVFSVAERELVQTNNTAALAVGSGGILSRSDYISKTVGTSFYDAICPTELGIYFYSNKLHSIYRLTDSLEALSDTKGMKSYFEGTPWTACLTAYDKANREILFTPKVGTTPQKTLVFSGYLDAFSGFYTLGLDVAAYDVYSYITFDKYLLSSNDTGNEYYLHNFGNWAEYYGVDQTCTLSLIVNPAKTNVVTYHVIEWITDLLDDESREIQNLTFDELQITNTHQDTDIIDISTYPDIKRRYRKWRLNTFRDTDSGRIRDSWIKAVFTYYGTYYNRKLVVHPINFMYTPTKIW